MAYLSEQPESLRGKPEGLMVASRLELENIKKDVVLNPAQIRWIKQEKTAQIGKETVKTATPKPKRGRIPNA